MYTWANNESAILLPTAVHPQQHVRWPLMPVIMLVHVGIAPGFQSTHKSPIVYCRQLAQCISKQPLLTPPIRLQMALALAKHLPLPTSSTRLPK